MRYSGAYLLWAGAGRCELSSVLQCIYSEVADTHPIPSPFRIVVFHAASRAAFLVVSTPVMGFLALIDSRPLRVHRAVERSGLSQGQERSESKEYVMETHCRAGCRKVGFASILDEYGSRAVSRLSSLRRRPSLVDGYVVYLVNGDAILAMPTSRRYHSTNSLCIERKYSFLTIGTALPLSSMKIMCRYPKLFLIGSHTGKSKAISSYHNARRDHPMCTHNHTYVSLSGRRNDASFQVGP